MKCVHELFEEQVERMPEKVALIYQDERLTYRELNGRANQLAHYLRGLGAGPETLVGLSLERSVEMVIGLLGILKAGGAYAPLDPSYPAARLSFMLEDAGIGVLVTQRDLVRRLPARQKALVCLDEESSAIARCRLENPYNLADTSNLAYVIYTSGSTGRPKGVALHHRGLCNLARAQMAAFYVSEDSRVLQFAPLGFDASVSEIFKTLLAGAALYIAPRDKSLAGAALSRLLDDQAITTVTLPPSALASISPDARPHLQTVVSAGEACSAELMARWRVGRRFINAYGPTEVTVCATIGECGEEAENPAIGYAMLNVEVHLLDSESRPVSVGDMGEIYVGGAGLARGYINLPEKTAERFLPNPFSETAGARLYRTGDLARYKDNGSIEFIGRIDHQVKIRGFRVELGEIETILNRHPSVQRAVVVVCEDQPGNKTLASYLVTEGEVTNSDLRSYLKKHLPDYMAPDVFMRLESLPLTPNGKIDRRALPAPIKIRVESQRDFAGPRDELEELLAKLWQDLFGIERIGIHDNFFELGGNSIQAAVFLNTLQEKLGQVVYVVALFDAPTIAGFAAYLSRLYPETVANICGVEAPSAKDSQYRETAKIDAAKIAQLRDSIKKEALYGSSGPRALSRNPRSVFVLAPPRSGSTLLRVMLGGNPRLFSPPELQLLAFETLAERKKAFSGRYGFWLEGTIRAIMEIRNCDGDEARRMMEEYEGQSLGVQEFYRRIQTWIGERTLIDKTPAYALDIEILKNAERYFESALYIHLLRHPNGMIRSFEEAKLDQIFRYEHSFSVRQLAELIWIISHQNITEFLKIIPAERRYCLKFEDLVSQPREATEGICQFLGVSFNEEMLEPYKNKEKRMTDGIHGLSRMLGDIKFHTHRSIDAKVAERWREKETEDSLGDITLRVAEDLGYSLGAKVNPAGECTTEAKIFQPIRALPRKAKKREQTLNEVRLSERAKGPSLEEEYDRFPLSYEQQRFFLLDQLEPGSPAYNIPMAVSLKGSLDVRLLKRSLNEIVRRHESLRTFFRATHGEPEQSIAGHGDLTLPICDLSELPVNERAATARRLTSEEARQPFDLTRSPLLRGKLLRLSGSEHALLLTMHHIISDGWSTQIILRELSAFYSALLKGAPAPLAELPAQYADYAVWQRERLRGEALDEQLSYWKLQLEGAPGALELPADHARPAAWSYRGGEVTFRLSEDLSEQLKELSRGEGVTLFMTLLGAWKALLMRYSGQTRVVVGAPVANRNRVEAQDLIGPFLNTLALYSDLRGEPSFRELLKRVREVCLGGYAHQEVPFEKLVEELQPERDLSRTPLVQVMFNMLNYADYRKGQWADSSDAVEFELLPQVEHGSKVDLSLHAKESTEGIHLRFVYNTDLFEATTIERMACHFRELLEGVAADPQQRLSEAPLLSERERSQLLLEWNDTKSEYPRAGSVNQLFEAQVEITPDAMAVVYREEQVSYWELNRRANQLAHHLRRLGVGAESIVGLCLDRSVEMIVGLLGALKAGGSYLPLDCGQPKRRLSWMVENAQPSALLTQRWLVGGLAPSEAEVICLDTDWEKIARESPANLSVRVSEENLAYVIYTSGSSGNPKGTMIEQRSVVNLARALGAAVYGDQGSGLRVSLNAPLAFDASVKQVAQLLSGHRLEIVPEEVRPDGDEMLGYLSREGVEVLDCTPGQLRLLLGGGLGEKSDLALKMILVGGEALDEASWGILGEKSEISSYNVYGPTECTVDATFCRIGAGQSRPRIGRPLANVEAYVLDRGLKPTPIGVPGELHIGGEGLARGYLRRPDLTAEKFVPHPYSEQSGARLYKTGDVARYRVDGQIEFIGRMDHQVKVRGYRIELGEIESALGKHESVSEAVVILSEEGEKKLTAYVVCEREVEVSNLKMYLKERLPDYMVPQAIVKLARMPVTANGKVDRRALPKPEGPGGKSERLYVAPRTVIEEHLAKIWADVLKVERVGVYDNFFELGGHSLLGMQVISRLRESLSIEVPLRCLFEASVVDSFAQVVITHMRALLLTMPKIVTDRITC